MLTQKNKAILIALLAFTLLHWAFFLTVFVAFRDIFTSSNIPYMDLPVQERELLTQNVRDYQTLSYVIYGSNFLSFLAYSIGTYYLFYAPCKPEGQLILPVGKLTTNLTAWTSILLFLAVVLYAKYGMGRCYVWMELLPFLVFSVEFLMLTAGGLYHLRKQRGTQKS